MTEWDACVDAQETLMDILDWDGCPDVLAESSLQLGLTLTMTDIMMQLILVQITQRLGTSTKIMTAAQTLHLNNNDLFMMMILDDIINDLDMCPLDPEDYDGDRDTDGCPEK